MDLTSPSTIMKMRSLKDGCNQLSTKLSTMVTKLPLVPSMEPLITSRDSCLTSNTQHPTGPVIMIICSLAAILSCSTVTGTNTLTMKENVKSVTPHAQADVQAVKSATNVTQLVEPVPDTQAMNVSTVGVEERSTTTDVVSVLKTDLKLTETNVKTHHASTKDVTAATRVYVFIVNMGMTFMTDIVNHAASRIVMI